MNASNTEEQAKFTNVILVGTYKEDQLTRWSGWYNYPLSDEDAINPDDAAKINELWLFQGTKEQKTYKAEFVGIKTREELIRDYCYPAKGKAHGDRYLLFKTEFQYHDNLAEHEEAYRVIIRTKDFATAPKVRKQLKAYLESSDRDDPALAKFLPEIITQLPPEQLCVCENAVQMELYHIISTYSETFCEYVVGENITPLFLCGEVLSVLKELPSESIDCCMTSPPYWNKRQYSGGGIGMETDYHVFIDNLMAVFAEVKRVLKPVGSFWLNIGDSYLDKNLLNIPSRVAIRMQDEQGWILRNTVIWNKVKGCPDNSEDKLRNVYEPIFHFVKHAKGYYYDVDSIRHKPHQARIVNGAVISATGVSGIRYKRKIELSTELTEDQKTKALVELDKMLSLIQKGEISDFRMIIKGEQRTTHSDSESVSGRARELHERGFYFLKYNPKGAKPSDLWDVLPEDTQGRTVHFAPFPEDLCKTPLLLTCPVNGIVLDPFSGTGTTAVVARALGRKSVGIDISKEYIEIAKKRVHDRFLQPELNFREVLP